MSEYQPFPTAEWFSQLPEDEARKLFDCLFVPASNPEDNNVLLEAEPADGACPSSPSYQSTSATDRSLSISPTYISNFDDTSSQASTTSETIAGNSEQKVINKAPCGLCQQRRRKCEIIQNVPKLCKNCKKKGGTACSPHIPNATFRENNASLMPESKCQGSIAENAGRNVFIYERGC